MTAGITHQKVATLADDGTKEVNKTDWNATHTIGDDTITDAMVADGINASHIGDGSVSNTEFQYLDGVTSAIQTQLDAKLNSPISSVYTGYDPTTERLETTAYQNTGTTPLLVIVSATYTTTITTDLAAYYFYVGASSPPTDKMGQVSFTGVATVNHHVVTTFLVPAGYYYGVYDNCTGSGTATINSWWEFTLGN